MGLGPRAGRSHLRAEEKEMKQHMQSGPHALKRVLLNRVELKHGKKAEN